MGASALRSWALVLRVWASALRSWALALSSWASALSAWASALKSWPSALMFWASALRAESGGTGYDLSDRVQMGALAPISTSSIYIYIYKEEPK